MDRPEVKISQKPADRIIEGFGIIGLILLIVLPFYFYPLLPELIPSHYNFEGEADRFSSKSFIFLFPALGTLLYFGLYFLEKIPHLFNYPVKISESNAEIQYRLAVRMLRLLRVFIVLSFLFFVIETFFISKNYWEEGTFLSGIVMLSGLFGIIILYVIISLKSKI